MSSTLPLDSTLQVHPKKAGSHHFLVCLDPNDSPASDKALEYVQSRLAVPGDLVALLSVLPSSAFYYAGLPIGLMAGEFDPPPSFFEDQEKFHAAIRRQALERLEGLAKGFAEGVEVHAHIATGDTVSEIIKASEHYQCDIVVVGRRKMGVLKRWVSAGSVSTALLANSDLSVLVVR